MWPAGERDDRIRLSSSGFESVRIVHKMVFRALPERLQKLEDLGVPSPTLLPLPGGHGLAAVEVDELAPRWPMLKALFSAWDAMDAPRREFSKEDLRRAEWLAVYAWSHGYPQPEGGFRYRELTYDLRDRCEACGVGKRQKAAFKMKQEPKWGKRSAMQLHWIDDELFVKPELWELVFRPFAVPCRPVSGPRGRILETVVQLQIESTVAVVADGLEGATCGVCGRRKWRCDEQCMWPHSAREEAGPVVRTEEFFGTGSAVAQPILIRRDVAQRIAEAGVVGLQLIPLRATLDQKQVGED